MNRRDIILGVVVLVLVVGAVLWFKRVRNRVEVITPSPSSEEQIEKNFNLTIPEDVDKAELRDISGGDGSAVATRKYENGMFTHTILADLPDPMTGTFYEGWLIRGKMGDANFAFVSTGRMTMAKGGYLLEFQSATDYSDYTGVVVSLEKAKDNAPEVHILEGSF